MNVVRDLRNTITHLQAQVQKKQKALKKQQQDYELIIAQLQNQNEKLKLLLQGDSITIGSGIGNNRDRDRDREEDRDRDDDGRDRDRNQGAGSRVASRSGIGIGLASRIASVGGGRKEEGYQSPAETDWTELINENTFLKNEIVQLSTTYQKQIDQLVFYFQKIKTQNKRTSPTHYTSQIKMLTNWIQTNLKDFENERQKYVRKLMECGETLDLYQRKFQEQNQEIGELRLLVQENQERLRIVSRIHW